MTDKNPAAVKKVYTLNALRGFSAVFVVFFHMVAYGKYLDPDYMPKSFEYFFHKSQLRVLIFFIISGAVISLSSKTGINSSNVLTYIKKRVTRIYPIYVVGLLLALLVAETADSTKTIVGNFAFLHVIYADVISGNGPVWTLHYEILFYLLFIPLSILDIDPLKAFIFSIVIGFVNFLLSPYLHTPIITSYSFGFAFWSLGMVAVKYFSVSKKPVEYSKLVGYLFLLLCIPFLYSFKEDIRKFSVTGLKMYTDFQFTGDIQHWFKIAFNFTDLAYIPYCFVGVLLFSERDFKYKKIVLWILQLVPAYTLFLIYRDNGSMAQFKKLIFPISCYAMSCLLFVIDFSILKRMSQAIIRFLIWMGDISYGTYITHIPVMMAFHKIPFFTGSRLTFVVRVILYFISTYLLAYFLEKHYQRWVMKLFNNQPTIKIKNQIKYAWEYIVLKRNNLSQKDIPVKK